MNCEALFLIEVKTSLRLSDIRGKEDGPTVNVLVKCKRLQKVLSNPDDYACSFTPLWKVCAALRNSIYPIIGADNFSAACENLCNELLQDYVKPTGPGGTFLGVVKRPAGVAALSRKRRERITA